MTPIELYRKMVEHENEQNLQFLRGRVTMIKVHPELYYKLLAHPDAPRFINIFTSDPEPTFAGIPFRTSLDVQPGEVEFII